MNKNADITSPSVEPIITGTSGGGDTVSEDGVGEAGAGKGIGKGQEQVQKREQENFKPKESLNQGIMRMNQVFSQKTTITIPGDFTLHAGDAIFVDAPDLQTDTTNDEVNKESGGLYIIADLCHYITPKETYTKLNLVRDTFGRKGKPT